MGFDGTTDFQESKSSCAWKPLDNQMPVPRMTLSTGSRKKLRDRISSSTKNILALEKKVQQLEEDMEANNSLMMGEFGSFFTVIASSLGALWIHQDPRYTAFLNLCWLGICLGMISMMWMRNLRVQAAI